ncbi:type IX secretion system anionic LPS delivery protein PorZ [Constantimarinum furrinae]|uniref:Transcriptional regulator n=1 Tax=Constantimarinum furrinae TaxID=2562285 RepID=A0A7G8PTG5_9FLAO|nr:two-component regulator propeller domain-containing protein [Constantimarinum furrinae]QNJ97631.1 Putative transcriptional regulator [Constantimarinum furrinae]
MKQLLSALLLLFYSITFAQNFENEWSGFFSYVSIKGISQGNDRLYGGAENAVFTFDLSTQEINTISTINGLSGNNISTIYYSDEHGLLIMGYENGLIEIVIDGEENVLKVVDILEKPTIPPDRKRINHFYEYEGNLYISTQYGISVYDLDALEFGDSYFIGDLGAQINIKQTTVFGQFIYAASNEGGLRRALVASEDLIDYEEWTTLSGGVFNGIQTLNNELYAHIGSRRVARQQPGSGFVTVQDFNADIVDFGVQGDFLTITTTSSIQTFGNGYVLQAAATILPGFDYVGQSGYTFNNTLYLGTVENGILAIPFGTNQATQILPDGPLLNRPFSIDASPGQLWVNFGDVNVDFNPYNPLTFAGISNLREGAWTNIPFEEVLGANDLVNISINPENSEEVYMTSFNKGLLKIEGQTPTILYNHTNSPMTLFRPPEIDIRIFGSTFDSQGNLWFVQSKVDNGLFRLTPSMQFQSFDITSVIPDPTDELALTEIAVSREGYAFFGSTKNGVVAFNPTGNVFKQMLEEQGSGNLPVENIRALTFDNQNRLWIGTLRGLRVLFNVAGFFEEGADIDAQPIIILEDGVPQELLFNLSITDIAVDGSNNKWISTATSGVFYLSPNGQETLLRFTKDNSPLPSNNVQDIAIDDFSGVVYFATVNGLVAYNGSSTAPRDNLENVYAYPNPVRPGFMGNVTIDGLTAKANVKITDITGNLVFEQTSEGGSVQWDTTAFGRYKVASGVYLVLITTEDALETKVSKIMIVR